MPKLTISAISIIFIIVLSSCVPEPKSKPDLLDKVKSDTKLIRDLKDVYWTFKIFHTISESQEIIRIRLSDLNQVDTTSVGSFPSDTLDVSPEVYLKINAEALILTCKNLRSVDISDDSVRHDVDNYISSTIRNARVLIEKGYRSMEFIADDVLYLQQSENYFYAISKAYSLDRFTKLTDDQYWRTIDKKNYIRQEQYGEYKAIVEQDLMAGFNILEQLTKTSKSFQEGTIYQIELADQFVKKDSLIRAVLSPDESPPPKQIAIQKYHAILGREVYSLYVFEAWLKWRTVTQSGYGFSKYSEIPNTEYEQLREKTALVVLDYVSRHQNDDMAINQFLLFATHEIVTRFGDNSLENQAGLDFDRLFHNRVMN
ncbi:MAG: hypothetical protein Q8M08_02690 [Bacteroidales bacterium]|nr:hypothetical protein [Bacteroidales bacterium]